MIGSYMGQAETNWHGKNCRNKLLDKVSSLWRRSEWSPTYTLTEDYALGMELTMAKWKCRYVEQYLAVGEAPEQLRNCFQQRSRWCKVSARRKGGQPLQSRKMSASQR